MINRKPESKDPWSTWSGPCRREAKSLHFSLVIPRFCRPSRPSLPGISLSPMCRGWKPIISVPEVGTNCASCVGNCQVRLYVLAITTHLLAAKTDAFGACDSPVDATRHPGNLDTLFYRHTGNYRDHGNHTARGNYLPKLSSSLYIFLFSFSESLS